MKYSVKEFRKGVLGDDYKKTFDFPNIEYSAEEWKKLLEFRKHCFCRNCPNCNKKFTDARKHEDENNYSLVLVCENCMSNDILEDSISKEYVKWLDTKLWNSAAM